jgi:hypothetical protein
VPTNRRSSVVTTSTMRAARVLPRERHVDVVVQNDDEPRLGREGENAIERGIGQAGGLALDLGRTNSL